MLFRSTGADVRVAAAGAMIARRTIVRSGAMGPMVLVAVVLLPGSRRMQRLWLRRGAGVVGPVLADGEPRPIGGEPGPGGFAHWGPRGTRGIGQGIPPALGMGGGHRSLRTVRPEVGGDHLLHAPQIGRAHV